MVKRRERRVGGCEKSIVEECVWSTRGMEEATGALVVSQKPLPTPLRCQRQLRRRKSVSITNVGKFRER